MDELSASFALTDAEARRVNGELGRRTGGSSVRLAFNGFGGLALIVYGFLEPVLWRGGGIHWTFVLWGATVLLNVAAQWGGGNQKPGIDTLVRFTEDGLCRERPSAFVAPWKAVLRAFDDGELIRLTLRATLRYPNGRNIVIPKRVFPDEGAALWQLLRNSLIGTRMLVNGSYARSSSPSKVRWIENTRS